MARINGGFDSSTVEPASFGVLPKGRYLCVAVDSEMKETKSGSGEYLQITFEVIDGDAKGRKIFERLNIVNSNKTAEEIAQRQLSGLCRAVGIGRLDDSDQLHNIPVVLEISIEPAKGDFGESNRIRGYYPAGGVSSAPRPVAGPQRSAPARPATTAAATPAWKRPAKASTRDALDDEVPF